MGDSNPAIEKREQVHQCNNPQHVPGIVAGGCGSGSRSGSIKVGSLCDIPTLDAHLVQHYGKAFDEYARRTSTLIPFVYSVMGVITLIREYQLWK
jgi:hypothetical protein